eukprot:3280008-Rhodomonas_salina.1
MRCASTGESTGIRYASAGHSAGMRYSSTQHSTSIRYASTGHCSGAKSTPAERLSLSHPRPRPPPRLVILRHAPVRAPT